MHADIARRPAVVEMDPLHAYPRYRRRLQRHSLVQRSAAISDERQPLGHQSLAVLDLEGCLRLGGRHLGFL